MDKIGIIPLLKPPGMTSHDCVGKLRRILKMKKIGHTGTLDPSVIGVLPICIGHATRVVEYIQDLPKEYVGTVSLGRSTTTEDADGETVEERSVTTPLSEVEVKEVLKSFLGTIDQVPPMYSAIKVNGRRLHELAREGKEIERKARSVQIYELHVLSMDLNPPYPEITIHVKCSKGTYIRTLCVDIGKKLKYPAHMKNLQRVASGPFRLKDCVTFEQIQEAVEDGTIDSIIKPLDWALLHYPEVRVNLGQVPDIYNGKKIRLEMDFTEGQLIRVYSMEGTFLALYKAVYLEGEAWGKPEKVFRLEGE
ncbi:tRNA pseudouridine(55) synthase TruB [Ammoniphilus sp. CFH 90114]|uniref:tRNA pseudouridine(55) synthase TruB n=1 Tax=Ammoniphilus sp. CFH 90114 TaxID=2493665 RepID=UPI00100F54F7|nr:tRNA pseudouridine(55) synthase TruB [Ammoniphilus sp. CFH 90114]RXT15159.1 tRNA pseudouridine(55) synthase TruB [Ammoniphilus sp. CFH 90114]